MLCLCFGGAVVVVCFSEYVGCVVDAVVVSIGYVDGCVANACISIVASDAVVAVVEIGVRVSVCADVYDDVVVDCCMYAYFTVSC